MNSKYSFWTSAAILLLTICVARAGNLETKKLAESPESAKGRSAKISTISLNSIETSKGAIDIAVDNTSTQLMTVVGVQCTANLFVSSFDAKIPAGKSGRVSVVYDGQNSSSSGPEFIRVKSNFGIQQIQVNVERPVVLTLSQKDVVWSLGEAPLVKSVIIKIQNRVAVLSSVNAIGAQRSASLVDLGNGQYRVDIEPGETNTKTKFPIVLGFTPDLPGMPHVILGVVE